jgi:hypothetical protein
MIRRQLRRIAKWICTIAAAMVLGLAVFSLFRSAKYAYDSENHWYLLEFHVAGGRSWFGELREGLFTNWSAERGMFIRKPGAGSWGMEPLPSDMEHWHAGFMWYRIPELLDVGRHTQYVREAGVNLFYPFLLAALPAGFLWWTDPGRFGPGRCRKCGYDRAGLAPAATCPECGTPPAPATV